MQPPTDLGAIQESVLAIKVSALVVIYLFLPLSAYTYCQFRRNRHQLKVDRILRVLKVNEEDSQIYGKPYPVRSLVIAVVYTSIVSVVGLAALMFNELLELHLGIATEAGADKSEGSSIEFPVDDSLLMLGMAFLGAYLWGMQYVLRRYMSDDLDPGVFYGLSVRMLLAGALAVVIFNAYDALAGGAGGQGQAGVGNTMWPAMAFVLGMFPQRGLSWLRDKIPMFSSKSDPSVRSMPLEMIEGVSVHDRLRLEESGLDNCYDLATTDFVPLAISTPYSARTLIDWVLQAKLCVYCGPAIKDLRQYGVRTIIDLEHMDTEIEVLAKETSVTQPALEQAKQHLERSREILRLREIAHRLGLFATGLEEQPLQPAPETRENIWHEAPGQRPSKPNEARP